MISVIKRGHMFKVLCRHYSVFILSLFLVINNSYADELSKSISGKFDAGGVSLYLECYGEISPSIIIQSGFNGYGSAGEWGSVIEKVSPNNRICVYDRANMGKSEKLSNANTINDTSKRLHTLLKNVEVNPPYIMVGHSYGSYPVRAYTDLYPNDAVGILLIDPSQYGQWKNRIAKWKPLTETYNKNQEADRLEELSYWNNPMKNFGLYDLKANEEIIKNTSNFKDIPFVLLWAKDGIWIPGVDRGKNPVWTRMKDMYLEAINNMNKLSTQMKVEFSTTSEHNIHYYEPETVIEQLNYLLKESKH